MGFYSKKKTSIVEEKPNAFYKAVEKKKEGKGLMEQIEDCHKYEESLIVKNNESADNKFTSYSKVINRRRNPVSFGKLTGTK